MRLLEAAAAAYLRSRQSPAGGFCFYRWRGLDEPNLFDTWHALAALRLLGAEVPRAGQTARFLAQFPAAGADQLYYLSFSLDLLGRSERLGEERLELIRALKPRLPPTAGGPDTTAWLQSTRRLLRLKSRFACISGWEALPAFLDQLRNGAGYGDGPNLIDTCLCLAIGAGLGIAPRDRAARDFVDSLQMPGCGFALTLDSRVANLEVLYAGTLCCGMLGLPLRHRADALRFVAACQTARGGFARAPGALADIEMTHRALQVMRAAEQIPAASPEPRP